MSYSLSIDPNLNTNSIVIELLNRHINKNTNSFSLSTPFVCGKCKKEDIFDGLLDNYDSKELILQILIALYNLQLLKLVPTTKIFTGFRRLRNPKKNSITNINNITLYHGGEFEYVINIEKTKFEKKITSNLNYVSDFDFDNIRIINLLEPYKDKSIIIALVEHSINYNYLNTNIKYSNLTTLDIILYNPKKLLYIYYENEENKIYSGIIVENFSNDIIIVYNIEKKIYDQISYLDIKQVPINLSGLPDYNNIIRIH